MSRVTLRNRPIRNVQSGPQPSVPVNDLMVIELAPQLNGLGEEDLVFFVGDKVSSAVRLRVE